MGLQFFKKINLGRHISLNIGKKGSSFSFKLGPFTYNTKGKTSINLGNGIKYVKYNKRREK